MRRFMITEVTLYVFFIPFHALWLNARTRVNSLPCHDRCRVPPYPMPAAREPFRRGLFTQAREGNPQRLASPFCRSPVFILPLDHARVSKSRKEIHQPPHARGS